MAVVPIITTPNKTLETPAEKVGEINEETKNIIQDLKDTLLNARNPEGAGLAAPQIGISKRICIARRFYPNPENPEETLSKEYVLVNPKIISFSKETEFGIEGCLSIPDLYANVERAKKIKIKALDENGETIRQTVSGFLARVIQHEIDHLDGILFTSRMVGDTYTEAEIDKMYEEDLEEETM